VVEVVASGVTKDIDMRYEGCNGRKCGDLRDANAIEGGNNDLDAFFFVGIVIFTSIVFLPL